MHTVQSHPITSHHSDTAHTRCCSHNCLLTDTICFVWRMSLCSRWLEDELKALSDGVWTPGLCPSAGVTLGSPFATNTSPSPSTPPPRASPMRPRGRRPSPDFEAAGTTTRAGGSPLSSHARLLSPRSRPSSGLRALETVSTPTRQSPLELQTPDRGTPDGTPAGTPTRRSASSDTARDSPRPSSSSSTSEALEKLRAVGRLVQVPNLREARLLAARETARLDADRIRAAGKRLLDVPSRSVGAEGCAVVLQTAGLPRYCAGALLHAAGGSPDEFVPASDVFAAWDILEVSQLPPLLSVFPL